MTIARWPSACEAKKELKESMDSCTGSHNITEVRVLLQMVFGTLLRNQMGCLTLTVPFTTIVAFAASVDQDQVAQNMQPDLGSTLSALEKLYKQNQQ